MSNTSHILDHYKNVKKPLMGFHGMVDKLRDIGEGPLIRMFLQAIIAVAAVVGVLAYLTDRETVANTNSMAIKSVQTSMKDMSDQFQTLSGKFDRLNDDFSMRIDRLPRADQLTGVEHELGAIAGRLDSYDSRIVKLEIEQGTLSTRLDAIPKPVK